jgi:hypothetical protein
MKKIIIIFISILFISSCSNKVQKEGNLTIKGQIKGLRLGNLLIKRFVNDSLMPVDSIKVDGNEKFEFHTNINEAQIMLLELPEIEEGRISFFAAPNDTINIFTYLESFAIAPKINGGKNQAKRSEYQEMIRKFNDKELDLFKEKFDATKNHNTAKADSLATKLQSIKRRRVFYTLNFIFNNKDKAIAPYMAMMEFYDNPKALDTIYKILPDNLKESVYGKEIKRMLK